MDALDGQQHCEYPTSLPSLDIHKQHCEKDVETDYNPSYADRHYVMIIELHPQQSGLPLTFINSIAN